jgi:hypothetical protein
MFVGVELAIGLTTSQNISDGPHPFLSKKKTPQAGASRGANLQRTGGLNTNRLIAARLGCFCAVPNFLRVEFHGSMSVARRHC